MKDKASEFLEHIEKSKSKNTFTVYKTGLLKFIAWYGKDANVIFEERKEHVQSGDRQKLTYFLHKIEEYFSFLLEKGYTRNSARVLTNGISGFFRFYGLTIELTAEINKKEMTTKDFETTIELYRRMFQVADIRGKIIISMGLKLGWRIGDFATLKVKQLPDLNQETPVPFEIITEKEKVIAKSYLDAETVELLKAYLPTLNTENEFLFQSNSHTALQEQSINDILKTLATKAKIQIPEGKRLRFHCFRKLFLTTCADLKIDPNIAKILTGKTVSPDMMAYLGNVNRKNAFLEVSKYLSLTNGSIKHVLEIKDAEIQALKEKVRELEIVLRGFKAMFATEIEAKSEQIQKERTPKGMMARPIEPFEYLKQLGQQELETEEKAKKLEYEKLLQNGNGENHEHQEASQ